MAERYHKRKPYNSTLVPPLPPRTSPIFPHLLATRPGNNLDSAATPTPYLVRNATFSATWRLAPGDLFHIDAGRS